MTRKNAYALRVPCCAGVRTLVALGVVLGAIGSCTESLEAPGFAPYNPRVSDLSAQYRPVTDDVRVQWSAPSEVPSFYRLFRWQTGGDTLVRVLDGALSSYVDVLDLSKGDYVYAIAPCRVDGVDTAQAQLSNSVTIVGGVGVKFTIDNGATSTSDRDVMLGLSDANRFIRSVRFTQKVNRYASKAGRPTVNGLSTLTPVRFTADDIALLDTSYYSPATSAWKDTAVRTGIIPQFGVADAENPGVLTTGVPIPANRTNSDTSFAWRFDMGQEDKSVFAEVTLELPDVGTLVDTLSYSMPIAPYRARMRIENRKRTYYPNSADAALERWFGPSDATALTWHEEGSQGLSATDYFVFSSKFVRFSLQIDIDSTFDLDFEYWLVFSRLRNDFVKQDIISSERYWMETEHRRGRLTGYGASHDEDFVYEYNLDTASLEGRENLSKLRLVKNTSGYPTSVKYIDSIAGTPGQNFRSLIAMHPSDLASGGKKAFFVVFKFTGRNFGDVRYVSNDKAIVPEVAGQIKSGLSRTVYTRLYLDYFAPKMTMMSVQDPEYLNNGDTITGPFNFRLNTASVSDDGKSRITKIDLVVANLPPAGYVLANGRAWSDSVWNFTKWTTDSITPVVLSDLLSQRVATISYPFGYPLARINDVVWRNLDLMGLPSGKYFIGIATGDENGYVGLAPVAFVSDASRGVYQTNPFMVTVLSGR